MSAVHPPHGEAYDDEDEGVGLLDLALPLARRWKMLLLLPVLATALGFAGSYLITPVFTSRTSMLPPQPPQSAAASAIGQLGALASLAGGGAAAIKSPADQYVALMQSVTVADRLIERFKLASVYDTRFQFQARQELAKNTRITPGKKDGLITIEVDDTDPKRAAAMATAYIDELRLMTGQLAITEAQQRRVFFEAQLQQTRDRLAKAQQTLEASGFNAGALKAEPKAAAEAYAKLRAELTAAEVKLQALRRNLADGAPEVLQQQSMAGALRSQLASLERSTQTGGDADYISKFREFKYQETLFELFARQYELARVDESREGGLIQVVDPASLPEWKTRPKRSLIAAGAGVVTFLLLAVGLIGSHFWRESSRNPQTAGKLADLKQALRRR